MTSNIKNKQLELLLHDFEHLAKTAMMQMQITTRLMQNNAIEELYNEAESNEIIMDRLEVKVREEVVFTIFQFNPIAADLRKIISYQDVTINLERIGDMLLNIIHFLKETERNLPEFEPVNKRILKMADYASEMLRNAIFSFSNEDSHMAYKVIEEDDKVDELFHQISSSLQDVFTNKPLNKREVQSIININAISYNLERIGDSATNIAESAIYLTEGKDIRHGNKQ